MPLIQCEEFIKKCLPCNDDPILNISAEDPDVDRFIGIGNYGPIISPPPLGVTFLNAGCKAVCYSTVSQAEADICALAQAQQCAWDDWHDPNGDPVLIFGNATQQCTRTCPDGSTFTWIQASNTVFALTQLQANFLALSLACRRAQQAKICITTTQLSFCLNESGSKTLEAFGGTPLILNNVNFTSIVINCQQPATTFDPGNIIRYLWSIQLGSLPTGLTLDPCTGIISGTPTSAGPSIVTIRATDAIGSFQQKQITINVVEITPISTTLPTGTSGTPYLQNFGTNLGDQEQQTWSVVAGSVPTGLTLTTAGVLSGTPNVLADSGFLFTVQVIMSDLGVTCRKQYNVTIEAEDSVILLSYWKMDEAAGTRFDSHGGNNLLDAGNPVASAAGIINSAAFFDPAVAAQLLNASPATSPLWTYTDGITIAGWIRMSNYTAANSGNIFYVRKFFGATWELLVRKNAGVTGITWQCISGTGETVTILDTLLPVGAFFFFRFWHDPADNKIHLKINEGAKVDSVAAITPFTPQTPDIQVGDVSSTDCRVDEIGIYQGVMSDADGAFLYNGGAGRTYPDVPGGP